MLGIVSILEEAGYEIEKAYHRLDDKTEAAYKRHNKLRAAIAECRENGQVVNKSEIGQILKKDEMEAGLKTA